MNTNLGLNFIRISLFLTVFFSVSAFALIVFDIIDFAKGGQYKAMFSRSVVLFALVTSGFVVVVRLYLLSDF